MPMSTLELVFVLFWVLTSRGFQLHFRHSALTYAPSVAYLHEDCEISSPDLGIRSCMGPSTQATKGTNTTWKKGASKPDLGIRSCMGPNTNNTKGTNATWERICVVQHHL